MKDSLLYKIFIRFLKENNYFNAYKKCISGEYFDDLNSKHSLYASSLLQLFTFNKINNEDNKEYKVEINHFLNHRYYIDIFCNIINQYLKKYCIEYIIQNNLLDIFVKTLIECKRSCFIIYSIPTYNDINDEKTQFKILNKYVNKLMENDITLFELINYAFTWSISKNGHGFWDNINTAFTNYLWDKLLIKQK